jgi:hypothetical protein
MFRRSMAFYLYVYLDVYACANANAPSYTRPHFFRRNVESDAESEVSAQEDTAPRNGILVSSSSSSVTMLRCRRPR